MTTLKTQCRHCPWRKDADLAKIPGYSRAQHRALRSLATGLRLHRNPVIMACHTSPESAPVPCVGWVIHELGPGNNLSLRLQAMDGRYDGYEVVGEQYSSLEDTIVRKES